MKLKYLVVPRHIELMKFLDIRKVLTNYFKPQERVVIAQRTCFLQLYHDGEEADTDYLARLQEAARLPISKLLRILNLE